MSNPAERKVNSGVATSPLIERKQLILASNRGPFDFLATEDGFERKRGSGGVVTVLSPIGRYTNPVWIAAARSEGDREIAREHGSNPIPVEDNGAQYSLRFVDIPHDVYNGYYNVISNPLLWFLHHYMWDTPRDPRIGEVEWSAWHGGYVPANRAFAKIISEEIERSALSPVVLIQDYQLYLVPGELRHMHPEATIQFFLHIPFPSSDYLRMLPVEMRQAIVSSLLMCDIIGFQTNRSAVNFLRAASSFVPDTRIDYDTGLIEHAGRQSAARIYPASVDPESVRELAFSPRAEQELGSLAPYFGERNILRVDRIEPSKNIVRGFESYSLMLDSHPELKGRVKFLAFLVPPRPGIPEYEQYQDEIMAMVGRINIRYGTDTWRPIEAFVGNNYVRALAAMRRYDVLLVNPLIDGMNVVSKEGVVVNERDGVIVLSEGAGSFEQFSPLPHFVSAGDILGTAEALYSALHMPLPERRELATKLRESVEREDVVHWLETQLQDIENL